MTKQSKFFMDTDNGEGPLILHRCNKDGSCSFATVEDVERAISEANQQAREILNETIDLAEKMIQWMNPVECTGPEGDYSRIDYKKRLEEIKNKINYEHVNW